MKPIMQDTVACIQYESKQKKAGTLQAAARELLGIAHLWLEEAVVRQIPMKFDVTNALKQWPTLRFPGEFVGY